MGGLPTLCSVAPLTICGKVPPGKSTVVRDAVYDLSKMVPADVWPSFAVHFGREPDERGFNAGVMLCAGRMD